MTVTFACGHTGQVTGEEDRADVRCRCGEIRITRVDAPPPRITGECSSPLKKG